jgi:hypothetical protein
MHASPVIYASSATDPYSVIDTSAAVYDSTANHAKRYDFYLQLYPH